MIKDRFVIFCLPRTGSTTFMNILNIHNELKCIFEPFNPQSPSFNPTDKVLDVKTLNLALKKIYLNYNGIKHVWSFDGWPFTLNSELNKSLVLQSGKIIFLKRRNILKRLVSQFISNQLNIWVFNGKNKNIIYDKILNFQFVPIDIELLKLELEKEKEYLEKWKLFFIQNHIDYIELFYEDIFEIELPFEERIEQINNIFLYLGVPILTNEFLPKVKWLISPSNKLNSSKTYLKIPGIEEIETKLSSSTNGSLFTNCF